MLIWTGGNAKNVQKYLFVRSCILCCIQVHIDCTLILWKMMQTNTFIFQLSNETITYNYEMERKRTSTEHKIGSQQFKVLMKLNLFGIWMHAEDVHFSVWMWKERTKKCENHRMKRRRRKKHQMKCKLSAMIVTFCHCH